MSHRHGCRHFFTVWYEDPHDGNLLRRNCARCGWNQRWDLTERGQAPATRPNPRRSGGVTMRQATPCSCGAGWDEIEHECAPPEEIAA